jgi:ADP-ribose pyrophosphatase YjhB (NUDIX family)
MLKKIVGKIWKKSPAFLRRRFVRTIQTKFTASVGAIVTNAEGKVLLLDHVLRPGSGWGIPGGFIEANEQPDKAVRRELCEEIGLEIESVELRMVRALDRHIEMFFQARARQAGKVQSFEINKIGWFAVDDLPKELHSAQKKLIRDILSKKDSAPVKTSKV